MVLRRRGPAPRRRIESAGRPCGAPDRIPHGQAASPATAQADVSARVAVAETVELTVA